jgi:hypothetical protein
MELEEYFKYRPYAWEKREEIPQYLLAKDLRPIIASKDTLVFEKACMKMETSDKVRINTIHFPSWSTLCLCFDKTLYEQRAHIEIIVPKGELLRLETISHQAPDFTLDTDTQDFGKGEAYTHQRLTMHIFSHPLYNNPRTTLTLQLAPLYFRVPFDEEKRKLLLQEDTLPGC